MRKLLTCLVWVGMALLENKVLFHRPFSDDQMRTLPVWLVQRASALADEYIWLVLRNSLFNDQAVRK